MTNQYPVASNIWRIGLSGNVSRRGLALMQILHPQCLSGFAGCIFLPLLLRFPPTLIWRCAKKQDDNVSNKHNHQYNSCCSTTMAWHLCDVSVFSFIKYVSHTTTYQWTCLWCVICYLTTAYSFAVPLVPWGLCGASLTLSWRSVRLLSITRRT